MQAKKRQFGPYLLNYIDQGEGEVLVFLHNGGGFWQIWEHQLRHFAQTHRVIALDWLGFGESAETERFLTLDLLYEVLQEFVAELGLKRFSLIGNCIGASVALKFQQAFPKQVQKLILFNVCPGERVLPNAFFRWFIPKLRGRPTWEKRIRSVFLYLYEVKPVKRHFPRILFGEQVKPQDSLFQLYVAKYQQRRQNLARTNLLFSVDTYTLKRFFQTNGSTDTLLIWGEANRAVGFKKEADFHRDLIRPELFVSIPQAGHLCMYEKPEMINRLIESYLSESDSKSMAAQ
jgi:pimeloyl-ACP methyl ester carboxylesterase